MSTASDALMIKGVFAASAAAMAAVGLRLWSSRPAARALRGGFNIARDGPNALGRWTRWRASFGAVQREAPRRAVALRRRDERGP